jgi:hypothetical protein
MRCGEAAHTTTNGRGKRTAGFQPALLNGLDFSEREKELFQPLEMGASALRELHHYSELLNKICERISLELPVVGAALKWGRSISVGPGGGG